MSFTTSLFNLMGLAERSSSWRMAAGARAFVPALATAFVTTLLPAGATFGDVFPVGPRSTFLLADASDSITDPTVINLSQLSFPVSAGDTLYLQRLGLVATASGEPETHGGMAGVFSFSNTILGQTVLNRVPGAIDAGFDYDSLSTFYGHVSTDIPQDFLIDADFTVTPNFSSVYVQVPAGAQYLFVAKVDSYYGDDSDSNGDFAVSVTPVPEPASLVILSVVAAAGLLMRRHGSKG